MHVGMGARLGILRETFNAPGIDLTVSRNGLPTANVTALTDRGDTLRVTGARVRVDSWRLVAGKSFFAVALAAGAGQDRYRSNASVAAPPTMAPSKADNSGIQTSFASIAPLPWAGEPIRSATSSMPVTKS